MGGTNRRGGKGGEEEGEEEREGEEEEGEKGEGGGKGGEKNLQNLGDTFCNHWFCISKQAKLLCRALKWNYSNKTAQAWYRSSSLSLTADKLIFPAVLKEWLMVDEKRTFGPFATIHVIP